MQDEGKPAADRALGDQSLRVIVQKLAARIAQESGDTELRALAEVRLAVEQAIAYEIGQYRYPPRSWRELGRALGVSAQAAHRRYGPRSTKPRPPSR